MIRKNLYWAAWLLLASSFGVAAKEPVASAPLQSSTATAAASASSASRPASATTSLAKEADLIETGHYVNRQGHVVHSPAHTRTGQVPDGATAQCADGSYSFSQSHRGTCSHHGGVARWLQ